MADTNLRQRKAKAEEDDVEVEEESPIQKTKTRSSVSVQEEEDRWSPWVDVLRVLSFLLVASCGLSYVITSGESWFWGGVRVPQYARLDYWKAQLHGPVYLTPEELTAYDGTDPEKPVYLAINGTIYDVSNGRHIYGPGGSYSVFAGVDAARAYVTGCFAEDRTPDMRGVEEMFLPLEDPETDAHWTLAELEEMRANEREAAFQRVHKGLKHWVDFFANSQKYTRVGYVKREDGWLEKTPKRELCNSARRGRSKRKIPK